MDECKISIAQATRSFPTKPYTNAQMEQLMRCELIPVVNCSIEMQRYHAMNVFAVSFSNMTIPSTLTFIGLLDRIIRSASSFKSLDLVESKFEILYRRDFKIDTFGQVILRVEYPFDNVTDMNITLFRSRLLRVDFGIHWNGKYYGDYTTRVTLSMFQPNMPALTYSVNSSSISTILNGYLLIWFF